MKQEEFVIHKLFSQTVERFADQIAMQVIDESCWQRFTPLERELNSKVSSSFLTGYTYREVESLAKRVAAFLIEQGYKKGDFAALVLTNCPEWGIIYLGIMYAGLTCVAIDSELSATELNNIFKDCQPQIVFTSYTILKEKIASAIAQLNLKVIVVDSEDFKTIIKYKQSQGVSWPEVTPQDAASLIYTSGTTAKPKGVILTHYNFCSNFRSLEKLNLCSPEDNFLSILPLYHTYAFMVTLLVPLLTGARITYTKSLKTEDLTRIVKETNITIFAGVPQIFSLIHNAIFEKIRRTHPLLRPLIMPLVSQRVRSRFGRSLRLLVSGGARLEPSVGKGLSRMGFRIIEGYGLTETSPVVALNPYKRVKFGSVGKAIPDVRIQILNPDKSGVGEVLIKGPNVMWGYFKQPELTLEVKSTDGWFNSQDLGYKDKEDYLFLTGRKKDVIVFSTGKNMYPEELEEYYSQSPYIKEICILQKSQEQFGQKTELLFAVVVPDFEYFRKKKELNIQEKIRWELENLSSKLPTYKRIMGFVVSKEELPRTHLRKIKRYEVSQRYLSQFLPKEVEEYELSEEDRGILDSEVVQRVIKYLSSQLNRRVSLNSHLEIDLGIDSLGRIELGAGLESLLSLKIPQALINNVFTIKELIINIQRIIQDAQRISEFQETQKQQKTWSQILNEAPPPEVLDKITVKCGFLNKMLTWIFKNIFAFIFRVFWFLKIEGRKFIPSNGPYVICANHSSYLDGFVLFASVPLKCAFNLFFIGHLKIFEHPLVRWTVKTARLISIDPVTHLTEALQACRFVLEQKKIICIFPEGGRSIDNKVQEFKKGIGILAKELNVWLIPVYIKGTHFAWPRTKRFPHIHPLKIIFGKPVLWQELGNDYATITKGLRNEVLKLKVK